MKAPALLFILAFLTITACQRDNTELYNEAVELEQNKEYEQAVAKLTEALDINKNDLECLNNRAWDYYDLNQTDKALDDFNRMLEIDPENTAAMYGAAYLDYEKGNYERALELFNKIIEIQGSLDQNTNRSKRKATVNAPLDLVFEFKDDLEDSLEIPHSDTLDISTEPEDAD